jgi:hypothetical protein
MFVTMAVLTLLQVVFLGVCVVGRETVDFDFGWRVSKVPEVVYSCPTGTFPTNLTGWEAHRSSSVI